MKKLKYKQIKPFTSRAAALRLKHESLDNEISTIFSIHVFLLIMLILKTLINEGHMAHILIFLKIAKVIKEEFRSFLHFS